MWIDNGGPETGWIAVIMRSTRSCYHYLLRRLRRNKHRLIRNALGQDHWITHGSSRTVVNGYIESKDIN